MKEFTVRFEGASKSFVLFDADVELLERAVKRKQSHDADYTILDEIANAVAYHADSLLKKERQWARRQQSVRPKEK